MIWELVLCLTLRDKLIDDFITNCLLFFIIHSDSSNPKVNCHTVSSGDLQLVSQIDLSANLSTVQ